MKEKIMEVLNLETDPTTANDDAINSAYQKALEQATSNEERLLIDRALRSIHLLKNEAHLPSLFSREDLLNRELNMHWSDITPDLLHINKLSKGIYLRCEQGDFLLKSYMDHKDHLGVYQLGKKDTCSIWIMGTPDSDLRDLFIKEEFATDGVGKSLHQLFEKHEHGEFRFAIGKNRVQLTGVKSTHREIRFNPFELKCKRTKSPQTPGEVVKALVNGQFSKLEEVNWLSERGEYARIKASPITTLRRFINKTDGGRQRVSINQDGTVEATFGRNPDSYFCFDFQPNSAYPTESIIS
ncbi:hypothetical protein ACP3V3_03015 [Vibrio sp. PNB22_3_1]